MTPTRPEQALLERYVKKILAAPVYDLAVRTPLQAALAAGERITLPSVGTFADGVAVAQIGAHGFHICRFCVDEVMTVSNDQLCAAIKDIYDDTRSITEPSGALAVAGIKQYVARTRVRRSTLVAIDSGANINFESLRHVAERAMAEAV